MVKSFFNNLRYQSIVDIRCNHKIIYGFPTSLSPNDLLLKYRANGSRRTFKYIHFTIDLLVKKNIVFI